MSQSPVQLRASGGLRAFNPGPSALVQIRLDFICVSRLGFIQ